MERITQPLSKYYFHSLKLYLDDLEEIEGILKGARGLHFSAKEFRFDNVAELAAKYTDQQLSSIRISAFDPDVLINLERPYSMNATYNRLYCGMSDPTKGSGIFYRLDKVLTGAFRKPRILYSRKMAANASIIVSPLLLVVSMMYMADASSWWKMAEYMPSGIFVGCWGVGGVYLPVVMIAVLTLWAVWAIWTAWTVCVRRVTIIISRRSQKQNFFRRNRDHLITGLVVGLIVAVVSVILTLEATKFFQSTPSPNP